MYEKIGLVHVLERILVDMRKRNRKGYYYLGGRKLCSNLSNANQVRI